MKTSIVEEFLKDPALFRAKRLLVAGDIALDRTFFCDAAPPGRHAIHAGESILDVRPHGDDFGAIGAAYNACLLSRSVGADSLLVTTTGNDPEADRVDQLFSQSGTHARQIRLPGVQTVTRFRFYEDDRGPGRYRLLFRADKDPDVELSYGRAEAEVCTPGFLDWWEHEAEKSDAILFSDTCKGFLSRRILLALDERTRRASERRVSGGKAPIVVIVDPKRSWEKYFGLKVDVFKPNEIEARGAVETSRSDRSDDAHLSTLGQLLMDKFGQNFPTMVVTLGEHGAAHLSSSGGRFSFQYFPALPAREPEAGIAMHCGDMFAAAIALSLSVHPDPGAAITFATYVASLQVSKPVGQKVTSADLTLPLNINHYRDHAQPPRQMVDPGASQVRGE